MKKRDRYMKKSRIWVFFLLLIFFSCTNKEPVTITLQNGVSPDAAYFGSADAGIDSEGLCSPIDTAQYVGYFDPLDDIERVLIKFEIPADLPADIRVSSAMLSMLVLGLDGLRSPTIAPYSVTNSWVPAETYWDIRDLSNPWDAEGGDFSASPSGDAVTISELGWVSWNLDISMVTLWLNDPAANNGLILKAIDESIAEDACLAMNADPSEENHPILTITYEEN